MTDPQSTLVAGGLAVLGLTAVSAFFSSSESAIFSLSSASLAEDGPGDPGGGPEDPRRTTLRNLRADPHRLLVTILVGNNVVNAAIASITTVLVGRLLPTGSAVTVATVLASFLILVLGEIVPKSYGLANAERWSLTVARPVALVERLLYPLVVVFDAVTRGINAALDAAPVERRYVEE